MINRTKRLIKRNVSQKIIDKYIVTDGTFGYIEIQKQFALMYRLFDDGNIFLYSIRGSYQEYLSLEPRIVILNE